ncbi:hypothetical protein PanWU01x14_363600, partial [Parasponia andersonii]
RCFLDYSEDEDEEEKEKQDDAVSVESASKRLDYMLQFLNRKLTLHDSHSSSNKSGSLR